MLRSDIVANCPISDWDNDISGTVRFTYMGRLVTGDLLSIGDNHITIGDWRCDSGSYDTADYAIDLIDGMDIYSDCDTTWYDI
jgi:hypothetical protein